MIKPRIAILTSGGDAPGMNSAIRAAARKGLHDGFEMLGVSRGYQGLIEGDFLTLRLSSVAGIINRGGTVLKTARSATFKTPEGMESALRQIADNRIAAVVVIGGDGSMAGARTLAAAGVKTMVIPGTIDNDMPGTEYSLGFDTALNSIVEAVNKIRDTAESHGRVAIIEVMGRNAGHLALASGLACGAEAILLPEIPTDMAEICHGLVQSRRRGKLYSIVIVAEGAGKGYDVATQIADRTGFSTPVTVLGYIQRGGSPSAFDNIMGSRMGALAVDCILADTVNCLTAWQNGELVALPYEQAFDRRRSIDLAQYHLTKILAK